MEFVLVQLVYLKRNYYEKKELKRLLEIANETIDGQKEVITYNSVTIEVLEKDKDVIYEIMNKAIRERSEGHIIISFLSEKLGLNNDNL